ncbi:hypothetical protein M2128_001786 [Polynucleobacter sphagniphilus]|nr:hypothetical protein [Polynucleobacter sphagniphilus]
MKVFVSLGKVENRVNSAGNHVNPGLVRIFYPTTVEGLRVRQIYENPLFYKGNLGEMIGLVRSLISART